MNARLNILIGMQVNLVQSIPVISYSDKRVASCGRKKRGKVKERLLNMNLILHCRKKKDLGFDSCLQLGPKQMCGYAKHLPKRSGRQEVGAETHNPSVHIHHEMAGGWREPGIWLYPIK